MFCPNPSTRIPAAAVVVTVPVMRKLNGFWLLSLLVMLMSALKMPSAAVFNCTVKVSLPPGRMAALSGSAIT